MEFTGILPSGKCLHFANWKDPPFFMGKSTISTGQFSIAMLVYQRVYDNDLLTVDGPAKSDKSPKRWLKPYEEHLSTAGFRNHCIFIPFLVLHYCHPIFIYFPLKIGRISIFSSQNSAHISFAISWLVVEPYPSEKSWSESQLG